MMTSSDKVFEVSRRAMLAFAALPMLLPVSTLAQTAVTDPLPSWNDTATKKAIATFVERVTKEGSPDFVPPAERIATFDNDGTLWAEQPIYFQLAFALDRVKVPRPNMRSGRTRSLLPRCSGTISRARSPAAKPPFSRSSRSRIPA
jgi:hypothetical protein